MKTGMLILKLKPTQLEQKVSVAWRTSVTCSKLQKAGKQMTSLGHRIVSDTGQFYLLVRKGVPLLMLEFYLKSCSGSCECGCDRQLRSCIEIPDLVLNQEPMITVGCLFQRSRIAQRQPTRSGHGVSTTKPKGSCRKYSEITLTQSLG